MRYNLLSLRKVDQLYHRTYASNPRARHDNHILEKYETGLVLTGQEVKAIKNGRVSIKGAYLKFIKKEAFAISLKVTEDSFQFPIKDKDRMKKVLMHKRELRDLDNFSKDRGATLVVLSIYDKDGVIKLQVAKARGKKNYDKRETLKEREIKREMDRTFKNNRGV